MVEKDCKKCNKKFNVKNYREKTANYCSRECAYTDEKRRQKMSQFIKYNPIPNSENHLFKKGHIQSIESRAKMSIKRKELYQKMEKKERFIICLFCNNSKKVNKILSERQKYCSKICADQGKNKGKTSEQKLIRQSLLYKKWRVSVFERDNYTCVLCFKKGGKLNADHIKRFAEYPDLRLKIENGRTLCQECHIKTDTYGNKNLKIKLNGSCSSTI